MSCCAALSYGRCAASRARRGVGRAGVLVCGSAAAVGAGVPHRGAVGATVWQSGCLGCFRCRCPGSRRGLGLLYVPYLPPRVPRVPACMAWEGLSRPLFHPIASLSHLRSLRSLRCIAPLIGWTRLASDGSGVNVGLTPLSSRTRCVTWWCYVEGRSYSDQPGRHLQLPAGSLFEALLCGLSGGAECVPQFLPGVAAGSSLRYDGASHLV